MTVSAGLQKLLHAKKLILYHLKYTSYSVVEDVYWGISKKDAGGKP